MRRAAKVDATQGDIVAALRKIGCAVEYIKKPLDLLVCFRGVTALMEVKNYDGKDQLSKDQVEFIARWPGKVYIAHTADEAVRLVIG